MKLFNRISSSIFLFAMIVFFAIPLTSCEIDPEPILTKPTITLKLSEESPQNIIILSWIPSDDADLYHIERTMVRDGKTNSLCFAFDAEETASDPNVTLDYPRNVKVEPAANVSNALTVSWNPVTNAQEYELYFSVSPNSNHREKYQKIATTTQISYTKENLTNLNYYYFMIKAINGDEYSLYSVTAGGFVPRE